MLLGGRRWAKKGEACMVRLSGPHNSAVFSQQDVVYSIRSFVEEHGKQQEMVAEEVVCMGASGPWIVVMAAYAAEDLLHAGGALIVSCDAESDAAVDVEADLLTPEGLFYKDNETTARARLERAAVRAERDSRTGRIFCAFPQTYAMLPDSAQAEVRAKVESRIRSFFEPKGADVRLAADVKTLHGFKVPKALFFITHPHEYDSMAAFLASLQLTEIKYFDVGQIMPAKTTLPRPLINSMPFRQCCFLPQCVPGRNTGRGERPCGRLDAFFDARRASSSSDRPEKKRVREVEMAAQVSAASQVVKAKLGEQHICRAWKMGRCEKNKSCPHKHGDAAETATILCCSARKPGDVGYRSNYCVCKFTLASCPYKNHTESRANPSR